MHTNQSLSPNASFASATVADDVVSGPVLLVENDEMDIFLFHRALRQVGGRAASCHAVASVPEAMTWLNELVCSSSLGMLPRLVVCDLRLNAGTSFDLIDWMNRREEFRDIPVVLWAGTMTDNDSKRAAELGISNTLTKSADIKELTEWLRTSLRHDRQGGGF